MSKRIEKPRSALRQPEWGRYVSALEKKLAALEHECKRLEKIVEKRTTGARV